MMSRLPLDYVAENKEKRENEWGIKERKEKIREGEQ
jgi:hypothetical protein